MKQRCYNQNTSIYQYYGGKGVIICDEWREDFMSFKAWADSHGYEEHLTIDRIDSNGNYCPNNCQFVTLGENVRRRYGYTGEAKYNKVMRYNREKSGLTIRQLADMIGLNTTQVSEIELGCFVPSLEVAYLISKTLNVSIETIFAEDIERRLNMISKYGWEIPALNVRCNFYLHREEVPR